ncbi:MAG: hybrid sensor histidine kinase/response regulator [Anaerolineae bacterium]|nr:hybrid sensor histidine kinase/response regulator [Anaerolineae bacterium]
MWKTLGMLQLEPDLSDAAQELMEDTARSVMLITVGCYLALQLAMAALAPDRPSMITWFIMPLVALSIGLALHWLETHFVLAQIVWQMGLALVITLAAILFERPEVALLYAMLPFMAIVTGGWLAGLFSEAMISVLSLGLWLSPLGALPSGYLFGAIGGGLFAGLIAWAASRTLYTVTQWSLQSFAQARQQTDAARRHRAQLALALQDLDRAYYRLERTNSALVVAWQTAAEAERFKAEFATDLSHELRTPLNLIIGFCELMMTAPHKYGNVSIPRPYRSDLNAIYQNARHLMGLVNDVIDLARIDAGKLTLHREQVELRELIAEVIDMVREYVVAKGLALRTELDEDLACVWIDRLRVRQVLLNLLVNAARFTDEGELAVAVTCRPDELVIRVSDTGRGILPADLPRIFEEFTQSGQAAPAGWLASSGLGLPISKRFIELHGGQMGVESIYGRGTSFWFTLPCRGPVVGPAPASEGQAGRLLRTPPLPPVHTARQLVVAVHDDARTIALLQRHMEGYEILGADSMAQGIALAQELRAVAVVAPTPQRPEGLSDDILFMSCPLPSARRVAQAMGASDLLIKPIADEDLWAAISATGAPIRRVLIADDDADMVRLLRRMLVPQIASRDCLEAHSGCEALEIARAKHPDLVLLDLVMPQMDGHETLAQLRADPELAAIQVIVISGQEQDQLLALEDAPISLWQQTGWSLGDMVRVLQANLSALAPRWR